MQTVVTIGNDVILSRVGDVCREQAVVDYGRRSRKQVDDESRHLRPVAAKNAVFDVNRVLLVSVLI